MHQESNLGPLPYQGAGHAPQDVTQQEVAPTPPAACTAACTSEAENANAGTPDAASLGTPPQAAGTLGTDQGREGEGTDQGDPLAGLAAAIANLTPADRAKVAGMLAGQQQGGEGRAG